MEETVVSDDVVIDAETVASSVVTVHSSSDGSVFAPPEPKRAKAVAKAAPKSLKMKKGKGKGVVASSSNEDPPQAIEPVAADPIDQTCEFAPRAVAVEEAVMGSQDVESVKSSEISGISGSHRCHQRDEVETPVAAVHVEAEVDVTVISSDHDIADLPSPFLPAFPPHSVHSPLNAITHSEMTVLTMLGLV